MRKKNIASDFCKAAVKCHSGFLNTGLLEIRISQVFRFKYNIYVGENHSDCSLESPTAQIK